MSGKITIIGLGYGDPELLTIKAHRALESPVPLFLRTEKHPVAQTLLEKKRDFTTFDHLYDEKEDFEEVYTSIVETLRSEAQKGPVLYGVPGNPFTSDLSVLKLVQSLKEHGVDYQIIAGISDINHALNQLHVLETDGLQIIDATRIGELSPDPRTATLVAPLDNQHLASEVKLWLMKVYDDETQVTLLNHSDLENKTEVMSIPLYQIDQQAVYDHRTLLYVPKDSKNLKHFDKLLEVMRVLRSPEGCPWDREQTHQSLKPYVIEEAYEVLDAIESKDLDNLIEELGDLLFQIVFHAELGRESRKFDMGDVIEQVNQKMISRHPHVFDKKEDITSGEVLTNWEDIKMKEKDTNTIGEEMDRIPKAFTALLESNKLQSKAAKVGFDWNYATQALKKVYEEADEVAEELDKKPIQIDALEEELGDLLFAAVNVARLCDISPETALKRTNRKFKDRFKKMEAFSQENNESLKELSLDEMQKLYEAAKKTEKEKEFDK